MTMTLAQRVEAFAAAFPARVKAGGGFRIAKRPDDSEAVYGDTLIDFVDTLDAVQMGGQDYRNKSGLYGAYPPSFLPTIFALFPDAGRILHLFSGSLTAQDVRDARASALSSITGIRPPVVQIRFDNALHPASRIADPDVRGNAERLWSTMDEARAVGALPPLIDGEYHADLIIADPPYDEGDQLRYWQEAMAALPEEERKPFAPLKKKVVLGECAKVIAPGGFLCWLDTAIPQWSKKDWIWRGGFTLLRSSNHRVRFTTFLEKR